MLDEALRNQFSREELIAMGEEVEPVNTEPGPDTQDSESGKPPEEDKAELIPDQEPETPKEEEKKPEELEAEAEPEEGKPVPYDRFAKIYGTAKQRERELEQYKEKLDLFKRDPEEYYSQYPDERPASSEKPVPKAAPPVERVLKFSEMLNAAVNDPESQDFHGKTLAELLEMGPVGQAAAHDYYQEYVESVKGKVDEAKAQEAERMKALKEEDNRFISDRANELFGKTPYDLDDIQAAKVDKIVKDTLAWMQANKRLGYKLEDAYKIMRYEETIKQAESRGAKSLVDHAKRGTVQSIGATADGQATSDPYAAFMAMTEDALEDKIRGMSDAKYMEFLKKATPAFKQKFPTLPYPD